MNRTSQGLRMALIGVFSWLSIVLANSTITAVPSDPMWHLIANHEAIQIELGEQVKGLAVVAWHQGEIAFVRPVEFTEAGAITLRVSAGLLFTPLVQRCDRGLTAFVAIAAEYEHGFGSWHSTSCLPGEDALHVRGIKLLPPNTPVRPQVDEWQPFFALELLGEGERPNAFELANPVVFYLLVAQEAELAEGRWPPLPTMDAINDNRLRQLAPQP